MPPSEASLSLQKTIQTLRRNFLLALRPPSPTSRSRTAHRAPLHALSALLLLSLVALLLLLKRALSAPQTPFTPDSHVCPPPSTPAAFARSVLDFATFVARARFERSTANHHEFAVSVLLRGPPPLAQYGLHVPRNSLSACLRDARLVAPDGSDADGPGSVEWLLVGTLGAGLPDRNATLLAATTLLSPSGEARKVWAIPWHALSREVAAALTHDPGTASAWWRARNAADEFMPSAKRAAAVARTASDRAGGARAARVQDDWWVRGGVSVVAACQDRTDSLLRALPSWRAAVGVSEIVLVDWGSSDAISGQLSDGARSDDRLLVARVDGQSEWVLSRAYNLALRLTSHRVVLKVDCDTELAADFLQAHPLDRDAFYAGDWTRLTPGATNALHANGVLLAHRDDLLALGGFDERITTYGWDDSELATRLARVRKPHSIRYEKLRHLPHAAHLRVRHQRVHSVLPPHNRLSPAVEIQRNRLLATKFNLAQWRASAAHTAWNLAPRPLAGWGARHVVATAANEVTPIAALVSEADAVDVAKRAIRLILHRYDVPLLPKSLSLQFYKRLADKVALPERYAEVVVVYRGGCLARLLAHLCAKIATSPGTERADAGADADADNDAMVAPPNPYVGWRLRGLWAAPEPDCGCVSGSLFEPRDEEVLSQWHDSDNRLPLAGDTGPAPSVDVTQLLRRFGGDAVAKNVSAEQLKWLGDGNGTSGELPTGRVLYGSTTCDGSGQNDNAALRDLKRAAMRTLVPARSVVDGRAGVLLSFDDSVLQADALAPTTRRDALGAEFATRVEETFQSGDVLAMARRWTATNSADHDAGMAKRAAALVVAARLARLVAAGNVTLDADVQTKVAAVHHAAEPLFKGCANAMTDYLETYPELAVIAAALISSKSCV